eukprot:5047970-Amphidinium_carterae.1
MEDFFADHPSSFVQLKANKAEAYHREKCGPPVASHKAFLIVEQITDHARLRKFLSSCERYSS